MAFDYEAALAACAVGDRGALRALYDREGRRLMGVALRIVRQRSVVRAGDRGPVKIQPLADPGALPAPRLLSFG